MSPISEADRTRTERALTAAIPRLLPPFLASQRWFGGKGRPVRGASLRDLAWLPAAVPAALGIAAVEYEEGPAERYVMLLGWAGEPREGATLGRLEGPGGAPWLVEAASDRDAAVGLLRGLCDSAALETMSGGRLEYADVEPGSVEGLPPETLAAGDVRLLAAEQSNTTFRAGRRHVFKLFRRLEAGENPEAEVTRFLTRIASFDGCPGLRGTIGYRRADAAPGTIGVLEDWVENHGDGWSHVLRLLGVTGPRSDSTALFHDLTSLGRVTAAFHVALASSREEPDFAPEAFGEPDREACAAAFRRRAAGVASRLRKARGRLPEGIGAAADRLLAAEAALEAWTPPRLDVPGAAFDAIRIHGDYHLGQTLKTDAGEGFVVIDFEGEPIVPRAERRRKQPALRDVAGMLRSFDYAVAAAPVESGGARDREALRRGMRTAFLAGYHERIVEAACPVVPAAAAARDGWVRFFELSKALYEVEYELDHRPAWLSIPLGGIERLVRPSPAAGRDA